MGIREIVNSMLGYAVSGTPADCIQIPQLQCFYQSKYVFAQARKIDFNLHYGDISGLEAYVDEDFIDMLEHLYKNAFEGVRPAEFKEIYTEIAKDDSGFILIIKNNGIILPSNHQSQLFELGYTTKSSPNRGYGLYIHSQEVN